MNCWSQHFEAIDKANEEAAAKAAAEDGGGAVKPLKFFEKFFQDKAEGTTSSSSTSTPPATGGYEAVGGAAYPSNLFSFKELVVTQMGGPCFTDTAILTPVDRLPGSE